MMTALALSLASLTISLALAHVLAILDERVMVRARAAKRRIA